MAKYNALGSFLKSSVLAFVWMLIPAKHGYRASTEHCFIAIVFPNGTAFYNVMIHTDTTKLFNFVQIGLQISQSQYD